MIKYCVAFLMALVIPLMGWTAGIDFFQGSFEEAKALAKKEGKLIFVDAYTTWCGPCKRMSRNVFTQDEVGSFYNETFINVKLDMEKGEGRDFQKHYRVSAFPTLLFIDAAGKVVHKVVGGMDVPNFMKLGEFAASKSDVSAELKKDYDEGKRDPEFMAQYVKALAQNNKPRIKIVNDYLSSQDDVTTEANLTILFYGAEEADSRIFNQLMKHRKKALKLFGADAMEERVEKAAAATVDKAIEFANLDLLQEAVDKVERYAPSRLVSFEGNSRLKYYAALNEMDHYLNAARDYAKHGIEQKFELANTILHKMKGEKELMQWAEKWATQAAESQSNEHHHFVAAQLGYYNGHYKEGLHHATKALEWAESSKSQTVPHIKKLIKALDEKLSSDKS